MKKSLLLSLLTIFLISCGNNSNSSNPETPIKEPESVSKDEPLQTETNDQPMSKEVQNGSIDDILKEFPDGIISYLSKKEKNCLNENAPFELLRQIELDLYAGRPFSGDAIKYFDICNIPPPPLPGEGESNVQTFPEGNVSENIEEKAYLVDIVSLNQDGVSPHLEVV
ncbi:MAG: hypothetical protein VXZ42_02180, partial [Actinomycetota bacterium]|nr:hypothetical protein [Actinomycetota bacterium]